LGALRGVEGNGGQEREEKKEDGRWQGRGRALETAYSR